jgi:hypothetical protein
MIFVFAMSEDYFLMGSSIADRSNRITIIQLVAQRLEIERSGYLNFFYLDNDIIIRKGSKEYTPNLSERGFFMGSSVIDKDNRVTVIRLVTQNIGLFEGDYIAFYLHDDEVVIRKMPTFLDISKIDQIDMKYKELILNLHFSLYTEMELETQNKFPGISISTYVYEVIKKISKKYGIFDLSDSEFEEFLKDFKNFYIIINKYRTKGDKEKLNLFMSKCNVGEEDINAYYESLSNSHNLYEEMYLHSIRKIREEIIKEKKN